MIKDGSSTFAVAIPPSASTESNRNTGTESVSDLKASPATTASRATKEVRCAPRVRAIRGARAPKTANASTGSDVSTPAEVGVMSSADETSWRTGPTLTAAGRRLKARATIPTSSMILVARVWGAGTGFILPDEVRATGHGLPGHPRPEQIEQRTPVGVCGEH